ncbi:MAG: hypothetical protein Ct9H90mP25_0350 [Gammaproteobacteria bacterium]|nr:MAG: hypothetical protein Ct9H90mP25_0350 [Gammaproteobacteria bacterium]
MHSNGRETKGAPGIWYKILSKRVKPKYTERGPERGMGRPDVLPGLPNQELRNSVVLQDTQRLWRLSLIFTLRA